MPEPNDLLRTTRERTPSRIAPGEHMTRAELADAVCAWLWDTTEVKYELDGHYIAKLERGAVRWPGAAYRSGLRAVLNVASDNDLGFSPPPGAIATEPDLTLPSTIGMDDDLVEAGDESILMLPFAEQSNVGDLTVEQLQADILRIAQSYLRAPTKPLFIRLRSIRDRAFRLLAGRQSPTQARDLYVAAGWAITFLAWMSVDLGRPDVSERHTRTAWACAEAADHDVLRAWIRATQHTAAFWQDDFIAAAEYAQDGLRYAAGTSALFLASAAAVDLARLGRADDAREALANARRLAATPEESEPGGPFLCTPERAEGIWSDAHLALGEADRTLTHADQSVALFEAAPYHVRNFGSERMVRLQQAKAHLALGELEGAAEALEPVLNTPLEYRVRPLVHRIGEAYVLTAPYARIPQARQIRERIRDFIQHPDLPARTTAPRRKTRPTQPQLEPPTAQSEDKTRSTHDPDARTSGETTHPPEDQPPRDATKDTQQPNAEKPDTGQPPSSHSPDRKRRDHRHADSEPGGTHQPDPEPPGTDTPDASTDGTIRRPDPQPSDEGPPSTSGRTADSEPGGTHRPDPEPPGTDTPDASTDGTIRRPDPQPSSEGPPSTSGATADSPKGEPREGATPDTAGAADSAQATPREGATPDTHQFNAPTPDTTYPPNAQRPDAQPRDTPAPDMPASGGLRSGGPRADANSRQ